MVNCEFRGSSRPLACPRDFTVQQIGSEGLRDQREYHLLAWPWADEREQQEVAKSQGPANRLAGLRPR